MAYATSTLGGISQVLSSASSRTGASNEAYGIARLSKSGASGISCYVPDGRGSVAQTTDGTGAVVSWRSYGTTGAVVASSPLGELPAYGFNGEEQDPKTGLAYMRARYLDTETGSFGVADTYLGSAFAPLSLNRYLYCLADPVNHVDPSGHKALTAAQRRLAQQNYYSYLGMRDPRSTARTLVNRGGNAASSAARYDKLGKQVKASMQAGGSRWARMKASIVTVYGIKGSNGRSGKGPMPSFDDAVRAAIARQHLLRYCGNDDNVLNDLLEESLEQREGLHAGPAIAGLFVPIIADLFEAGMYSAEGDDAAAATAFAFAVIGTVSAGIGASLGKLALKGNTIVDIVCDASRAADAGEAGAKGSSKVVSSEVNAGEDAMCTHN